MKRFASLILAGLLLFLPSFADAWTACNAASIDTTPPTVSSITIGANGTSWTFAYSENVTCSTTSHCCDDFTAAMTTAGIITLSYASGSGASSVVCTGSPTVNSGDVVANGGVDYTTRANGIEDAAGNDLASFTDHAVTNNSTQGGGGAWYYPCDGTDTFATEMEQIDGTYWIGSKITGLSGKSITKLSFKLGAGAIMATACKIAVYDASFNLAMAGATISTLTNNSWNDSNSLGGYSVTGDIYVVLDCNYNIPIMRNVSYDGYWGAESYATFPNTTISTNLDSGKCNAVRVWAQ